jgi:GMP synthase-like glutamine amidotransferase
MKLGVLKADNNTPILVDEFGEYADMFERLLKISEPNIEIKVYDIQNGHYPKNIDEVNAYVLTGSMAGAYEELIWFSQLEEFILRLHRAKKKLIGVCFGHQFIAHVLGGRVEKSSKGWGLGRHTLEFTESAGQYTNGQSSFDLIFFHQDQVIIPATGSITIAGSDFCPIAMCRIEDHILTFQGHPEFTVEFSKKDFQKNSKTYGDELCKKAIESIKEPITSPLDHKLVSQWITSFINEDKNSY